LITKRETETSRSRRELRRLATALLALLALFVLCWAPAAGLAQRGPGQRRRAVRAEQKAQRHKPAPPKEDTHRHGAEFMKRLRELPPDEQERILANDERFRRLPPERQQQIRENLRRWNALGPEQKQMMRERQEIVESLSPAQRQQVREVFPQYRRLPPERRQAVMQAFRHLRGLPAGERQRYLASPEVEQRLSPQERNVLEGMNQLLPPSPGDPSGDSPWK